QRFPATQLLQLRLGVAVAYIGDFVERLELQHSVGIDGGPQANIGVFFHIARLLAAADIGGAQEHVENVRHLDARAEGHDAAAQKLPGRGKLRQLEDEFMLRSDVDHDQGAAGTAAHHVSGQVVDQASVDENM